RDPKDEEIEIKGKVVDPDDRPVPGARVYSYLASRIEEGGGLALEQATCEADGTFRCSFRKPPPRTDKGGNLLVAAAPGFGPGFVEVEKSATVMLKLVKDDVPIAGRILDREGKPLSGVTLKVFGLQATAKEDLSPFLQAVKDKKSMRHTDFFPRQIMSIGLLPGLPATVTTDAEGRFRLTGM